MPLGLQIPIEIFYREINSRLILALSACLKGYRVYIGSKSGIDQILNFKIKKKIKGGIYLNKSQIISNPKYLNKIKKICNHFVVIDEELTPGVVNLKEVIINRTINEEKISKFFVLGKKIKKDILKYKKNFKCEIVTSGWPKYDVYRKQYSKLHLKEISYKIPKEINWILRIDGHTDVRPIKNEKFSSNWHLSSSRAIKIVNFLISEGIPSNRLVAAGFGEFSPLINKNTEDAFRKNRRIEIKLTNK